MKRVKIILCCFVILLLTSCATAEKAYKEGMANLEVKNYTAAEECFKKAVDDGYTKDNVRVIYTIVSEYNNAKECFDADEYEKAREHFDKIPNMYGDYLIGIDINVLKEQIEEIEKLNASILKAKNLLESGDYDDANAILLMLDTSRATEKQLTEVEELKKQVKLEKKNNDHEVITKIENLVQDYVWGLCEAVNTGDFRALKGSLYEGSSIYETQKAFIAKKGGKGIYEFALDAKVNSVKWTSETECIISTSESYEIYDNKGYRTQTFRYTYGVIETKDKQLFLTSIKNSK